MTEAEAVEILQDHEKTPDWVNNARKDHKTYKALFSGEGFIDELVKKIEKLESDTRIQARKNFSRSIKDTTERLLRPLDNVYTANGGTKSYDLGEKDKKKLINIVTKIRDNKGLTDWLRENWIKDFLFEDPNGVVFLEYVENKKIYPTYKSINYIRGYEADGQKLNWIIFEPYKYQFQKGGEKYELWRIVDEENDRTFLKNGDQFTIIKDLSFKHPFGEVPGLINSPITVPGKYERLSPANKIDGILKEYSRDQSVLTLYKYTNLMPIFWRYAQVCPECNGTGKLGEKVCNVCNGTGYLKRKDVTDEVIIPIPEDGTNEKLAPDIAGFIAPDLDTARYYREELNENEILMYESLWGSHKSKISETTENKTATEIWLNTQPVMTRLNYYSELASYMDKQLTEWVANWAIKGKQKDKQIATINYGTRFIIDPPDAILDAYNRNREKGAPAVILDRQLHEYLTSKYQNDPQTLQMELTKKQLEPFIHYSLQEVSNIFGNQNALKKALFADWWETIQWKDTQSKTLPTLEKERDNYIEQRREYKEITNQIQ